MKPLPRPGHETVTDRFEHMSRRATVGCLFSGMGGLASGFVRAGFEIAWATDKDEFACETFRHRFPHVALTEGDIREISVEKGGLAPVHVLAAGFPCQSFSQAGSRRGFEDPRGALFFEIPRLLSEFAPDDRPPLVVLENVPHLLYGADGAWFDQIRRALRRSGYWFREESCWIANVKDETDIPQDRERLLMVAASRQHFSHNPFNLAVRDGVRSRDARPIGELVDRTAQGSDDLYLSPENRYYKMIDLAMANGTSADNLYQLRRSYVREKKLGLCPTLTANMGVGGHNVPFLRDEWGIRRLTVDEVARLQGFRSDDLPLFPAVPIPEQYRLLGNAACVCLVELVAQACMEILRKAGVLDDQR